ncbi:pheromone receptor Rcb2 B44 [Coprinopsis sp. MPI-PUGE-AT-0042]|nr:pheromone receptor Rcb2 B44 [Coprinopsis sp. MPI-PUGE-AT-0042]
MTLDPTYPLFPVVAFIGFVVSLVPLPWHLQAWNSGTCFFMMWTSLACLNQFVNSLVWSGNVTNHSPVWCEISIRILLGASVGIPASSLCIVRRLYSIASVQNVAIDRIQKRRSVIIDACICVLFPLVYIALQYVVQGHRYDIFEDIGCYPALYNTALTYVISYIPPLALGVISFIYCGMALYHFNMRRIQFSSFLNSGTTLTMSRYLRLMGLALVEMCCTTPLAIFVIVLNSKIAPSPYISWEDTHWGYSQIQQVPRAIWGMSKLLTVSFELTRWLAPFSAILFFIFFGFAEEAKKQYAAAFTALLKRFGIKPPSSWSSSTLKSQLSSKASFTTSSKKAFVSLPDSAASTPLPLHSSFDTSSIATLSVFEPPEYKFENDPSTYVLDIKAPEKVYDIESSPSPLSSERTFVSDLTMFSVDTSSRRYTM